MNEMATHIQVSLAPVLTWNSDSMGINRQLLGRQRQVISILWSTINTQEYTSLLHSSFYLFKAVFRVVCVWEILSNCPLKHWFEELPKLNIKRVVHFTQLMHTNFVLRTAVTFHQLNGNAFLHLKCFQSSRSEFPGDRQWLLSTSRVELLTLLHFSVDLNTDVIGWCFKETLASVRVSFFHHLCCKK